MNIETARRFLLYCTLIDYAILILWFLAFVFARDWLRRLHGKWFQLTNEHFDALHYAGMTVFKIGVMLFNLAPLVALHLVN